MKTGTLRGPVESMSRVRNPTMAPATAMCQSRTRTRERRHRQRDGIITMKNTARKASAITGGIVRRVCAPSAAPGTPVSEYASTGRQWISRRLHLLSRSRMRKRSESMSMPRLMARLRACWVAQAAVGCAVTPAMCRRRAWWSRKARAGAGTLDPAMAPSAVLASQAQHEFLDGSLGGRPSGTAASPGVVPSAGDEPAVPGQQRARCDREDLVPVAARDQGRQGREPQAVCGFVPYSRL